MHRPTPRSGNAAPHELAPLVGPALMLAALLLFNLLCTPGFADVAVRDGRASGALIDILQNGAPIVLIAVGMTLVIALGGIDLSVGSVMALSGCVAALLVSEQGCPFALALPLALLVGLAAGAVNGALAAFLGLQPIVATLILLVGLRGAAQTLTADQKIRFHDPAFLGLADAHVLGLPLPVLIAGGVALGVWVMLRVTPLGTAVAAAGDSPDAARRCGVRTRSLAVACYAGCGACAAIAGLLAAADIREGDPAAGLAVELDAILAVVIGGTRLTGGRPRVLGSVMGALVMQTLTVTLLMRNVTPEHALAIKAAVALSVCLLQTPRAELLFGRVRARPVRRALGAGAP